MILTILFAYLLGSIPFGLLVTKAAGLGDVRTIGSGNIGATNVLRTGNKKLAALTLLLDMGKGFLAVALARSAEEEIGGWFPYAAGITVMLGHIFPVWLKFKGGKGVATGFGVLFAAAPVLGLAAGAGWLGVFALTKISSLSALAGFGITPLFALLLAPDTLFFSALIAALLFFTHRANIHRLLNGEESAFKRKDDHG